MFVDVQRVYARVRCITPRPLITPFPIAIDLRIRIRRAYIISDITLRKTAPFFASEYIYSDTGRALARYPVPSSQHGGGGFTLSPNGFGRLES